MEIQAEQKEAIPFQIVYNARSNKGCRSRKTSLSIYDKEKVKGKMKKIRKMTLNPESLHYQQLKQIEETHQRNTDKSFRGQKMEEAVQEFDFTKFLNLGPKRLQSQNNLQLQNGISYGIGSQKDLDNDFNWNCTKQPTELEIFDVNEQK